MKNSLAINADKKTLIDFSFTPKESIDLSTRVKDDEICSEVFGRINRQAFKLFCSSSDDITKYMFNIFCPSQTFQIF